MNAEDKFWQQLRRIGKEESKALPSYRYGQDPAKHVKFDRERGGKMKREIDEVEILLDLWAEWMRRPEGPEGHRVAVGFMTGSLKDSEELYEAAENDQIQRIDAAFESLKPIYKEAIMRKYGLGSRVWRFGKDVTFEDAKIVIRVKFVAKGLL